MLLSLCPQQFCKAPAYLDLGIKQTTGTFTSLRRNIDFTCEIKQFSWNEHFKGLLTVATEGLISIVNCYGLSFCLISTFGLSKSCWMMKDKNGH